MNSGRKKILFLGILFLFLLLGYRYSLYQDVSKLSYLLTPETVTPFQWLITYTFMIAGIFPTILIITAESFFCHTIYPAGIVQTVCNGQIFTLSDPTGFAVYTIASFVTVLALGFIWDVVVRTQTDNARLSDN